MFPARGGRGYSDSVLAAVLGLIHGEAARWPSESMKTGLGAGIAAAVPTTWRMFRLPMDGLPGSRWLIGHSHLRGAQVVAVSTCSRLGRSRR